MALIDYGPSNSHLELRRGYPYNHIMPDLNGRRYANYLMAARLADVAGKPAPMLRERAADLKTLFKQQLWNKDQQWFEFITPKGRDLRWSNQMFKLFGSGVLDAEADKGLLSHLNEREFLSRYGLHSLSKLDVAYDPVDIDNGGPGSCTSFPPQIAERLYKAGHAAAAEDSDQPSALVGRALALLGRFDRGRPDRLPEGHAVTVHLRQRGRRAVRDLRPIWNRGPVRRQYCDLPAPAQVCFACRAARGKTSRCHL